MTNQTIMRKVSQILDNLNQDMTHHKAILAKYKKGHCWLSKGELVLNSTSIACGSSAAVALSTGLGATAGIALSITTALTAGSAVLCNLIDQRILHKIHIHYQLLILARTLDLKLFEKYLYDDKISEQDFLNILNMMESYYKQKDLVQTKSLFISNNINELALDFKTALNGKAEIN